MCYVNKRISLRTNSIACPLAPACRRARANSEGCGCSRFRCCRNSSRFARSDSTRAVSVSSSSGSSKPSCLDSKVSSSSGGSTFFPMTPSNLVKSSSEALDLVRTHKRSLLLIGTFDTNFSCSSWSSCSTLGRLTFANDPISCVGQLVKKVPSQRRAEPVRWNRAEADSTAASAICLACS